MAADVDHPNHWNGVDTFGSGATFNGDATDPTGTYSRVFEVASGANYGADVHVAFAAFTALGAGLRRVRITLMRRCMVHRLATLRSS